MNIHDIGRNDSIKCKVVGHNQKGCFLAIVGIENSPTVRLFNVYLPVGSVVLASVRKITKHYVGVSLDSIMDSEMRLRDRSFAA